MDRRLQAVNDRELRRYWRDLAIILSGKVDPATGLLPPYWQGRYDKIREEFARRGVQLSLFTE
jgi:hypothetical protein